MSSLKIITYAPSVGLNILDGKVGESGYTCHDEADDQRWFLDQSGLKNAVFVRRRRIGAWFKKYYEFVRGVVYHAGSTIGVDVSSGDVANGYPTESNISHEYHRTRVAIEVARRGVIAEATKQAGILHAVREIYHNKWVITAMAIPTITMAVTVILGQFF